MSKIADNKNSRTFSSDDSINNISFKLDLLSNELLDMQIEKCLWEVSKFFCHFWKQAKNRLGYLLDSTKDLISYKISIVLSS